MPTIFVHEGAAIDYTPSVDTPAGTVVVLNDLIGVTKSDISAGKLGALAVEGVFDFEKVTGTGSAIPVGTLVYWDDTAKKAVKTAAGNKLLGKCVRDAGDNDTTVRVRLTQ